MKLYTETELNERVNAEVAKATSIIVHAINERFDRLESNIAIKVFAKIQDDYPHIDNIISQQLVSSRDAQTILGIGRSRLCQLSQKYPEIKVGNKYNYDLLIRLRNMKRTKNLAA